MHIRQIIQKDLSLIIIAPSIIAGFFSFKFFYYNTLKKLKFAIIAFGFVILCFAIVSLLCDLFMSKVLGLGLGFFIKN